MPRIGAPGDAATYSITARGGTEDEEVQAELHAALRRLRQAQQPADENAARAELRQLLSDIFAEDMQVRQRQATEIEARLAKLRQQYQAREKVKDEIIELQIKVLEKEADGLGFPPTRQIRGAAVAPMIGSELPTQNLPPTDAAQVGSTHAEAHAGRRQECQT